MIYLKNSIFRSSAAGAWCLRWKSKFCGAKMKLVVQDTGITCGGSESYYITFQAYVESYETL